MRVADAWRELSQNKLFAALISALIFGTIFMNARVSVLESQVREVSASVASLHEDQSGKAERLSRIESQIESVNAQLIEVKGLLKEHKQTCQECHMRMSKLSAR